MALPPLSTAMQKLDAGHETDVITPPFGSTGVGVPHEDDAAAAAVGVVADLAKSMFDGSDDICVLVD